MLGEPRQNYLLCFKLKEPANAKRLEWEFWERLALRMCYKNKTVFPAFLAFPPSTIDNVWTKTGLAQLAKNFIYQ